LAVEIGEAGRGSRNDLVNHEIRAHITADNSRSDFALAA
jgi:hypothetical protein